MTASSLSEEATSTTHCSTYENEMQRSRIASEGWETEKFQSLRRLHFPQLNDDMIYLDHAGTALCSAQHLHETMRDLSSHVYGNPHSKGPASSRTQRAINEISQRVLKFVNAPAEQYTLLFTSGATAAFKLIGESFPWTEKESQFVCSRDSHTSVVGIRQVQTYALRAGADFHSVPMDQESTFRHPPSPHDEGTEESSEEDRDTADVPSLADAEQSESLSLFAFPAECNFSGRRHDISKVSKRVHAWSHHSSEDRRRSNHSRNKRWLVLVDAAKYASTASLDLSSCEADFVIFTFYKIFGYPSGLGALIVKNDVAKLLNKSYFGGGTTAVVVADQPQQEFRERFTERFTDGTPPFQSILSLKYGFNVIESFGGMDAISRRLHWLASHLASQMAQLKHYNGTPVAEIYGDWTSKPSSANQGPIVSFNLKRSDGSFVGYTEVEQCASERNIQIRTGCFCNPGACQEFLHLSNETILANFHAGHTCWDDRDIMNGFPTGAIRVSLGLSSALQDIEAMLQLIREEFVELSPPPISLLSAVSSSTLYASHAVSHSPGTIAADQQPALSWRVHRIVIYPVKSCAAVEMESNYVGPSGFRFDREWAIVDASSGEVLRQKQVPSMALITPSLDVDRGLLVLSAEKLGTDEKLYIRLHLANTSYSHGRERNYQKSTTDNASLEGEENIKVEDISTDVSSSTEVSVCGGACSGWTYGSRVSLWISKCLQIPCHLVRKTEKCDRTGRRVHSKTLRHSPPSPTPPAIESEEILSSVKFANEAPLTIITTESVLSLHRQLTSFFPETEGKKREQSEKTCPNRTVTEEQSYEADDWLVLHRFYKRFRANLWITSLSVSPLGEEQQNRAHQEDEWKSIRIGGIDNSAQLGDAEDAKGVVLTSLGQCRRCSIVNIDQETSKYDGKTLKTLSKYRRNRGDIFFGSFFSCESDADNKSGFGKISVGDPVSVLGCN